MIKCMQGKFHFTSFFISGIGRKVKTGRFALDAYPYKLIISGLAWLKKTAVPCESGAHFSQIVLEFANLFVQSGFDERFLGLGMGFGNPLIRYSMYSSNQVMLRFCSLVWISIPWRKPYIFALFTLVFRKFS